MSAGTTGPGPVGDREVIRDRREPEGGLPALADPGLDLVPAPAEAPGRDPETRGELSGTALPAEVRLADREEGGDFGDGEEFHAPGGAGVAGPRNGPRRTRAGKTGANPRANTPDT